MDFEFSPEQDLLRSTARSVVRDICPPKIAQQWDEGHVYPEVLFKTMADLGWFALPLEDHEKSGRDSAMELAILSEELGRASFDVAMCYIVNVLGALVLQGEGTVEQREWLLPSVIAGDRRLSVSLSEPDAGSDLRNISTSAVDDGDAFVLNGQKMWCTGAGLPGTILEMYVRTGGKRGDREGLTVLLVDPLTPGVELRKIPTLARHILGTYEVYLSDVRVPKGNVIGAVGGGWEVLLSSLELERVLLSGGYVGAAQATLDDAVAYARERVQFGRPIGTFQAVAHPLAELQAQVDAARLLTYRAAWLLSQGRPCLREGSMAKLCGSETYLRASREGMQTFGGYGFSTESVMSFRYREAIVTTISGGTSQIQKNVIARSMGLKV